MDMDLRYLGSYLAMVILMELKSESEIKDFVRPTSLAYTKYSRVTKR